MTGTSFDMQPQENGKLDVTNTAEDVSFILIEAGSHVLADGAVIKAGWSRPT